MRLEKSGSSVRTLRFEFQDESDTPKEVFEFDELSEGQRNLVLIFTLLHAGVVADSTLFLDEPDNYINSREIQPWLSEMVDRTEEVKGQCILVSHHSEALNYLAPTAGLELYREGSLKPTRVRAFEWSSEDDALSPAELVARGWR
jgi:ATPase subunit of ABC transporter with duplicated ATPase domains